VYRARVEMGTGGEVGSGSKCRGTMVYMGWGLSRSGRVETGLVRGGVWGEVRRGLRRGQ
jgi:hypothetical protein